MVKLAEISEATGFSIPVVSRVLSPKINSEAKIAPRTRQLILDTALRMGYRPNRNAEFLKRGQNPVIGVFLPYYRNDLITDLVMGISQTAQEQGFPVSFSFETRFATYQRFIENTKGQRNCGIITYPHFEAEQSASELIRQFSEGGGKLVLINARQLQPQQLRVPHVDVDDLTGGRIAAERLLYHKCDEYLVMYSIEDRKNGFEQKLAEAGVKCRCFREKPEDFSRIFKLCRESGKRIGIFCGTDRMAVKIHTGLLLNGLKPGERVKLIGYDNLFLPQYLMPALTTISQPFFEIGCLAMRKLVDVIYGHPAESVTLQPELVIRETA